MIWDATSKLKYLVYCNLYHLWKMETLWRRPQTSDIHNTSKYTWIYQILLSCSCQYPCFLDGHAHLFFSFQPHFSASGSMLRSFQINFIQDERYLHLRSSTSLGYDFWHGKDLVEYFWLFSFPKSFISGVNSPQVNN